jgi:tetratricopeptide (TPR) repeat protein
MNMRLRRHQLLLCIQVSILVSCSTLRSGHAVKLYNTCSKQKQAFSRIDCLAKQIKQDSNNIELYLNRAEEQVSIMMYYPALADYHKAFGMREGDAGIARSIARIYATLGMRNEASEWFERSGDIRCSECFDDTDGSLNACPEDCVVETGG